MQYWEKIVTLRPLGTDSPAISINNSKSAAHVLLKAWPARRGKSYRRAVLSCSAALRGEATHELAQWAFIVAAMEAAIPYEIVDRLDAEIAAVCREIMREKIPQPAALFAQPQVPEPQPFWWPKRDQAGAASA
jgi:hypothetical protein